MKLSKQNFLKTGQNFSHISSLSLLILVIGLSNILDKIIRFVPPLQLLQKPITKLQNTLDPQKNRSSISRSELIYLATQNMQQKKTRTKVTVGGMTIGIAAIVFLVSIGYGLQDLVINRVARLEEMRQVDVSVPPGSNLTINDKSLSDFKGMSKIKTVAPMIAIVAKASYQKSATDLVAYGVTRDYLDQSAISPVKGTIFDSNQVISSVTTSPPNANTATSADEENIEVSITIDEGEWLRVRDQANPNAKLLGYTQYLGSSIEGKQVLGGSYLLEDGDINNTWIQAEVPIWEKQEDESYQKLTNDNGSQVTLSGYVATIGMSIEKIDRNLESIDTDVIYQDKKNTTSSNKTHQVVVNRATLKILGIKEDEAIGKEFDISFIVTGELLADKNEKIVSDAATHTIIGVTPDDKSPVLYVPFVDLRSLGLVNFSQVKLSVTNKDDLPKIRKEIEVMGYNTASVADTVSQINSLFSTIRTMLAILGMIALSVASLGMFNTLTISLLERTHEVGLMKAMGMKSSEIKDLFLAESIIMGSMGGVLGLITGYTAAKILEVIVSGYAMAKGVGYLNMVSIPFSFVLVIIILSLLVGFLTGLFPAKRATKISALNALRYE